MDLEQLPKILSQEPPFRLKQAQSAIYQNLLENWTEATVFSLPLREKLTAACPLKIDAQILTANDQQTVKAVLKLADGKQIETVLMKHQTRRTVCLSCQVGCPLACTFCATGQAGFTRNLTVSEMVAQVLLMARLLKKQGEKVTNLVFMGMGEPFLNYDNVLAAIRILNDHDGFNLGARHISISTAGITEGIRKLAKEKLQVNLAVSLHAPNDQLRKKIMPVAWQYPLARIFQAVDDYIEQTNRQVMFEYLMIKDVNDSAAEARQLVGLMNKPLYLVNLITYNPTGDFDPSTQATINKFQDILMQAGIKVTRRYRFGRGIKAGCGQLAVPPASPERVTK
ncbi:MAG: 23S rRNA (adenine(2503)-C(2))-methyltransferase RlmN [Patescibacteria group bacterium]